MLTVHQALHEGVLTNLLKGIVRQFQIRAAYLQEAVICDKARRKEIIDIVNKLKVSPDDAGVRLGCMFVCF